MIRLVLAAADLRRIRIGRPPSPFAETMVAAGLAQDRSGSSVFGVWQQSLKGQLGPHLAPLAATCPAGQPWLDLNTLVGHVDTVGEGVEKFMAVGREHLQAEIGWLRRTHTTVSWPWQQLDADLRLRRELAQAIVAFHDVGVGPHWRRIMSFLHAERNHQIQRLATSGIDAFLAELCPPLIQWRPPVLEILSATEAEWDLKGGGLEIVPSAFLTAPASLEFDQRDRDRAPTLHYPAVRELAAARRLFAGPAFADPRDSQPLAALVGRTRGAVLAAIADGCGTGELAVRVGISPAAVSQHAGVLRRSGLIMTRRNGGSVVHNVTPLGASLLAGSEVARGGTAGSGGR
jgi:DNA-binding transcriptional ArsR family regulator